jgi:hypothetical protein
MSTPAAFPPILFDREGAADYLSLSARSLNELQRLGELLPKKYGNKRLYLRDDLEAYARRLEDWPS